MQYKLQLLPLPHTIANHTHTNHKRGEVTDIHASFSFSNAHVRVTDVSLFVVNPTVSEIQTVTP